MAYNTGNPLGSQNPKDLYDNAVNFDYYAAGEEPFYPNRLGVLKLSISGMNEQFNTAQDGRAAQFASVLAAVGYSWIGDYGAGLTFTTRQQYTVRGGLAYTVDNATTLPYTTTGTWATDQTKLKLINSDQILRQDLANGSDPTLGAALVARASFTVATMAALLTTPVTSTAQLVYLKEFFAGSGIGGGNFMWDSAKPKSTHDGGTVISPTVPWSGAFSTLAAFLAGTGETTPAGNGCWVRQGTNHEVHASWFGATVGDTTKDNAPVLAAMHKAAIARTAPVMPMMVLPSGELTYSASPNFAQAHAMRLKGQGLDGTRLRYTGSGAAILCDASAYGSTFKTGFEASDMLVDLTASGLAALRLVNIDRGQFTRVMSLNGAATSLHFDLQLAVLCKFDSCGMTVNRWAVTSYPQEVFRLAASALGQNTTACTFINCSGEGATLANWRFLGADFNTTIGGTGEASQGSGRGVLFGPNTKGNTLITMTCESNPGGDMRIDGIGNRVLGGYAITVIGSGVVLANSSKGCRVEDLITQNFSTEAGALNNVVSGLKINARGANTGTNPFPAGTFSDAGTGTQYGPVYDMTAGTYSYPRKASFAISATVGSFTYTNNTTDTVMVTLAPGSGGTITQILYGRTAGENSLVNPATGQMMLLPGDYITVSSATVAAVMSGRRMGNGSL